VTHGALFKDGVLTYSVITNEPNDERPEHLVTVKIYDEQVDQETGYPCYVDEEGNEYVVCPDGVVIQYTIKHGKRVRGYDSNGVSFSCP
jgi:hypothetical protein